MAGKIKIRQVRGAAGKTPRQRATLRALGLGRVGREVVKEDRPEIRGMIRVVSHLVEVVQE